MKDSSSGKGTGPVVLLAEDNGDDVVLIRRTLDQLGFAERCMVVSNGDETIAYLQGDGKYANRTAYPFPDILFLDYRMPILSGLGVLCWLRSEPRFEHLPVVILSGACSITQAETAARLRSACCAKPLNPAALMAAVAQSVRRAVSGWSPVAPEPEPCVPG